MFEDDRGDSLSEADKTKVVLQVDYFISLIEQRYDIKFQEIVEAVRWAREHRENMKTIGKVGIMTLIGVLVTAMLTAVWHGAVGLINGGKK